MKNKKNSQTQGALRLRQSKLQILRNLPRLTDQLSGVLTRGYTRCGKQNCRCAHGKGHLAFSLTYMLDGRRHVDRVPLQWAEEVRRRVKAGRKFRDAVRRVLAINVRLMVLARKQEKRGKKQKK
jgi:hypothetical protein